MRVILGKWTGDEIRTPRWIVLLSALFTIAGALHFVIPTHYHLSATGGIF